MSETRRGPGERGISVVAFVRSATLAEPVEEAIQRIRRLDAEGVIDRLEIRLWPDEVRLRRDGVKSGVVEHYERFASWANRACKSLEPAFEVRTCRSEITGESGVILRTPVMGLAVYEGRFLRAVFPHEDTGETHTVAEAIERLAAGEFRRVWSRSPSPDEGTCPECGTTVVNVQGLLACAACDWTGARPVGRPARTARGRRRVPGGPA